MKRLEELARANRLPFPCTWEAYGKPVRGADANAVVLRCLEVIRTKPDTPHAHGAQEVLRAIEKACDIVEMQPSLELE